MASITVSVPEETKRLMHKFSEMNWSGFVKQSIEQKAQELNWKEKMLDKLKEEEAFTKWSVELGKKAKKGRFERLLAELPKEAREKLMAVRRNDNR